LVSAAATLTSIKWAEIAENGRYLNNDSPKIFTVTPPAPGGAGGNYVPQACVAVTLTTAQKRGLAHQGRFYLPPAPALADSSSGRMFGVTTAALLNTKTFINAINAAYTGGDVIVASNRGSGKIETVTGLRMGDVMDTQQRRRRQLVEQYSVLAL
jgi:hypothetical protein